VKEDREGVRLARGGAAIMESSIMDKTTESRSNKRVGATFGMVMEV